MYLHEYKDKTVSIINKKNVEVTVNNLGKNISSSTTLNASSNDKTFCDTKLMNSSENKDQIVSIPTPKQRGKYLRPCEDADLLEIKALKNKKDDKL